MTIPALNLLNLRPLDEALSAWRGEKPYLDVSRRSVHCPTRPQRRIAILGSIKPSERPPYEDPTWEFWGINDCMSFHFDNDLGFRADRWFELHPFEAPLWHRRPSWYKRWLERLPIPLYQFTPAFPHSRRLDAEALSAFGRDYFTCTMAYQIALALSEGVETIAMYGMQLTYGREALVERPCVEWWLGLAQGLAVDVKVYHEKPVALMAHPYRYGEEDQLERQYIEQWANDSYEPSLVRWLDSVYESHPARRSRPDSSGRAS